MLLKLDAELQLAYDDDSWGDTFARLANSPAVVAFSLDKRLASAASDPHVTALIDIEAGTEALTEVARTFGCVDFAEFRTNYGDELTLV